MPDADTRDVDFSTEDFSVFASVYINLVPNTSNPHLLGKFVYTNESSNRGWLLDTLSVAGSDFFGFLLFRDNGSANYIMQGTVALAVGENSVAATVSAGNTKRLYANGTLDSSSASGNLSCLSTSGLYTADSNGGSTASAVELHIAMVWSRVISDLQIAHLHFDPFCFLVPLEYELSGLRRSGLLVPPLLNGLGGGGPFFNNRLG